MAVSDWSNGSLVRLHPELGQGFPRSRGDRSQTGVSWSEPADMDCQISARTHLLGIQLAVLSTTQVETGPLGALGQLSALLTMVGQHHGLTVTVLGYLRGWQRRKPKKAGVSTFINVAAYIVQHGLQRC